MPVDNPNLFADKFRVKSARLLNWNYSCSGLYFITICTHNKNKFLGKIVNGKMELSKSGKITEKYLTEIPKHFPEIRLDEYVLMPNHVHILFRVETPRGVPRLMNQCDFVETHHDASLTIKYKSFYYHRIALRSSQTIPLVIKQFKAAVKRECNRQKLLFTWQARFYDRVIRTEKEYWAIKQYIENNPKNWHKDVCYK
jgi:REP element-mobilizing transposase RayT